MKWFRENKTIKFVWLVLALHILNASIDPPDVLPESIPEDLTINEIESMTELVAEDILDINNAMPEHDEHDSEDGTGLDSKKVCSFCEKRFTTVNYSCYAPIHKEHTVRYQNFYSYEFTQEVNLPPEA